MTWTLGAQRIKGYTPEESVGCHLGPFLRARLQALARILASQNL
jgi:hypothetical protein